MKKGRRRALIVVLILVVAGVGASYWFFGRNGAESAASSEEQTIVTAEAVEGSVRVVVEGPGSVSPVRTLIIRSGISGTLILAPTEGESYAQGQTLARFDTAELEKAVRQAEINVTQALLNQEKAAALLEQTQTDLASTQRLVESGAATRDQADQGSVAVQTVEFGLRTATLSLDQARLALETAQDSAAKATIRAPFAGTVLESDLGIGDVVGSGAQLVVFADLSRVRIEAEIDEYDIGKVTPGLRTTVTGDALGEESRTSTVERISPAAEVINNIPIFTVSSVIDNSDGVLRPGMNTDMSILVSSDKGIVVPSSAISTVRSRSYIDVYADEVVETRRVTVGVDDGASAVVTEGLAIGDLVVLPSTVALTLTSGLQSSAGASIIPISVPGTGGTR